MKKVFRFAAGAAIIAISAVNFSLTSGQSEKDSSGVALSNAKAMSQVENVFDMYVLLPPEKCIVYIGGEPFPGYVPTCIPGNTFPVCGNCYIFE
ncbi:MAG: hypothetical protein LBL13_00255 [Bacteroidales bacterium]|jgi:hypothetical protein|nr:hypothetical protein [Bacteroidales bacterium]